MISLQKLAGERVPCEKKSETEGSPSNTVPSVADPRGIAFRLGRP